MGVGYNFKVKNLFSNGHAQQLDDTNFTYFNYDNQNFLTQGGSFALTFNAYGNGWLSNEFIEVDTSKYYQFAVNVKTIEKSYNNRLGSGHIGFACYDEKKRFIDLRHCGGVGNTYLSRALNSGDEYVYIQSNSGWVTGSDVTSTTYYFRHIMISPPNHPEYGTAHEYTRIGYGDYNIYYKSLVLTDQGDYQLKISTSSNADSTMPNIGYSTPAGTPVFRGVAGGSYNYALGAPTYPESWTTMKTGVFTGENRNSSVPFRYATKYVKFLNLANYNYRNERDGDSARYAFDSIFLTEVKPNKPLPESFFRRDIVW